MTIERHDPEVAIKVVPMYIEGEEPAADDPAAPIPRGKTAVLGALAALLAVLTVAALVSGIVIATALDYRLATTLSYAAIGLSVLAVIGGVAAVILDLGRRWGIAAVILGIVANPLVLLVVLRFLGGLEAG